MCRMASIPPRERRLRRKISNEINGCYWEAFNRRSASIIHVFLLSISCGTPLINNLDSCPLILKDVWFYNKVRMGGGGGSCLPLSMSEPPWERVFICNSVHKSQRIDAVNSGGRAAHCQSHPIIPAQCCAPSPTRSTRAGAPV